jgi:predicted Rossmann-fold nucleotide-binding protein
LGDGQQPEPPASIPARRYRVTVFGSARPEPGHWVYEEVKQMCSALSAMNCDIITGGGPGLMQAANEGARAAQTNQEVQSIGIRVQLPFEQDVNLSSSKPSSTRRSSPGCTTSCSCPTRTSLPPGGLGTLLESMMIWQLLQVRHLHDTPLIFAGPMWRGLVEWASAKMLRPGFELASSQDMQIPCCVDNAAEAVAIIREHHARWLAAQGKSS